MARARSFGSIRKLPRGKFQAHYWHLGKQRTLTAHSFDIRPAHRTSLPSRADMNTPTEFVGFSSSDETRVSNLVQHRGRWGIEACLAAPNA